MAHQPLGPKVTTPTPPLASHPIHLKGTYTTLVPLDPAKHTPSLWRNIGGQQNDTLWTYLPQEPFESEEEMRSFFQARVDEPSGSEFVLFAILLKRPNANDASKDQTPPAAAAAASVEATPAKDQAVAVAKEEEEEEEAVGVIAYLDIQPSNQVLEIGAVIYGAPLQRSPAGTEVIYLLLNHSFNSGYGKVVWKANALNAKSVRAAARLGFVYEGTFRRHQVVKGRWRDSAWFGVLREDWEGNVRGAFEGWLAASNFDGEGKQKRRLEDFRQ